MCALCTVQSVHPPYTHPPRVSPRIQRYVPTTSFFIKYRHLLRCTLYRYRNSRYTHVQQYCTTETHIQLIAPPHTAVLYITVAVRTQIIKYLVTYTVHTVQYSHVCGHVYCNIYRYSYSYVSSHMLTLPPCPPSSPLRI